MRVLLGWLGCATLGASLAACPFHSTPVTPRVVKDSAAAGPVAARTVSSRDSVLEQRLARLELRLAERDAQVEDLDVRLDEARQEVVRTRSEERRVGKECRTRWELSQ